VGPQHDPYACNTVTFQVDDELGRELGRHGVMEACEVIIDFGRFVTQLWIEPVHQRVARAVNPKLRTTWRIREVSV